MAVNGRRRLELIAFTKHVRLAPTDPIHVGDQISTTGPIPSSCRNPFRTARTGRPPESLLTRLGCSAGQRIFHGLAWIQYSPRENYRARGVVSDEKHERSVNSHQDRLRPGAGGFGDREHDRGCRRRFRTVFIDRDECLVNCLFYEKAIPILIQAR